MVVQQREIRMRPIRVFMEKSPEIEKSFYLLFTGFFVEG